jgi:hypothetical protein
VTAGRDRPRAGEPSPAREPDPATGAHPASDTNPAPGTNLAGDTNPGRDASPAGDAKLARDRDQAGRARNARPRDPLGRPLPRGTPGEPTMPDDLALAPAETLALAQRLLDEGRPFHAHEVLEAAWKASPAAERELWRGLAQIAVGLTHVQRGNATGAAALLRRGGLRVAEYAGRAPYGIDAAQVAGQAAGLADQIGAAGLPAGRVTFRLAG